MNEVKLDPVRNRTTFTLAMGADPSDDDLAVARLILMEEGVANPDAELVASISGNPELIARRREKEAADIGAKKQAEYLRSPEGRIEAQVKRNEEREAREAKANLARDFLVDEGALTAGEAAELGVDEAIRAARMEHIEFRDMTVEEQDQHLAENPDFAAAEEARLEREHLLDGWLGMDSIERAYAAASAGADSVAEVEAEMQRRGRDIGKPIAGTPAVEEAFRTAKERS